ncbi:hypothetical protein HD554DRAFT_1756007 [Boletus coccyginus]|nr:hypothetical protein HD554DRAFT_1756007 [Boletus coccyginus]
MPERKAEVTANGATARGNTNENYAQGTSRPSLPQCLTLLEDETTRCCQPATEGHPKPERCRKHHAQYRALYKKYKDASRVVDDVKGGIELPTREEIGRYTDWHAVLEKVDWMCDYLEAVRVEKAGREIHSMRFFLEVDDGHRHRVELLDRKLVRAEDVLDALQSRADEIYKLESTPHATNNRAQAEAGWDKQSRRTTAGLDTDTDTDDKYNSKVVDDVKGGAELPTQEEIGQYTDWHAVLEKVSWVCDYLEAIRMEREIHQKRCFPQDDGHKRRLTLLERMMLRAEDVLDALQSRANELYKPESTLHTTIDRAPPKAEVEWVKQSRRTSITLDTDTDDKDSSKVVDDVDGGAELPTLEEIGQYTDWHAVLEKVSWVCDYLEAIRVEKSRRGSHHKQFFLEGECK